MALAGVYWPSEKPIPYLVSIAAFGAAANVAVIHALWRVVYGHEDHIWEPTRRESRWLRRAFISRRESNGCTLVRTIDSSWWRAQRKNEADLVIRSALFHLTRRRGRGDVLPTTPSKQHDRKRQRHNAKILDHSLTPQVLHVTPTFLAHVVNAGIV